MKILLSLLLNFLFFAPCLQAQTKSETFSFYLENDARVMGGPGSDQAYSNGFQFSFLSADNHVPQWADPFLDRFPYFRNELQGSKTNFGVSLGQQIYTPNDTSETRLIGNDRPYAGWLYVGFMANFKTTARSQMFDLSLGVVGPEAQGEQVQNTYHEAIRESPARGWKNQLATEPALQFSYQQRLRFFELGEGTERYFDAIPYFGLAAGNVNVGAHMGGLVRLGLHLRDDFGPTRPSGAEGESFMAVTPKETASSVYVFAGSRGIGVLKNIFLDGNTWRESHHVRKYPFVVETEFGVGAQVAAWSLAWRFVSRSPEFEQKSSFNSFASISISYSTSSL